MYKKSLSVIVVLCLLGMGSFAFGGTFGGPWSFQGDWHNTATDFCKPGVVGGQTNDWYDWDNWGMQNNGNNGCAVTLFDNYIFLAVESKYPEPCVSTWNDAYPGTDANGYDLYATQVFVMPWAWEYAPAGFRMNIEAGNINCGRMLALAYNVPWPASWNAYPILDVNGGTIITPGYRNFDANFPYDVTKFDDPCYPWVDPNEGGLWVGGGGTGNGENWGIVNIRGSGKVIMPRIRIMNGEVNIFPDGLLYHNDPCTTYFFISQARARNHINVAGGELRLIGDRLNQVLYYLSKGRLIPCDLHGDLHIDFNGFDTSVTATCTPDSAWNPIPIDGAISVPLNKTLTWAAGPKTVTVGDNNAHTLYFGTDFNEVNDATTGGVVQDACSYTPGTLIMDTNYFWRVDEHNDVTVYKGNVWAFKSKGPQASDPIPGTDAVGLPIPIVLKWSPGAKAQAADGHRVFFGTSEDDVSNDSCDNSFGTYRGTVSAAVYDLSALDVNLVSDTNYYWRIDEVNAAEANSPWKGETWHVVNTNYFVLEDFESYTDNDAMLAKWDRGSIDYTPQGSFDNSNGVIDLDANDGVGQTRMQYDYNNAVGRYYSEVRLDVSNLNFNGGDALPNNNKLRSLAIGLQGNAANHADPDYDRMYVMLEDTVGYTHMDMAEINNPDFQKVYNWGQWYVNLTDLSDQNNVQLANIKYVYIGFGIRDIGGGNGGGGRVRIDDIRLYQKACLPEYGPVGDLTSDCVVSLGDVDVMANAWLAKQVILPSVTNPGTTGLQLWYKFDETTGTTVTDSSGYGRNGEVNSTPPLGDTLIDSSVLWSPSGGYDGNGCFINTQALQVTNYTNIEANKAALDPNQKSYTFAVWMNADQYTPLTGWARMVSVWQDINLAEPARQDENEVVEIDCPVPRDGTGCMTLFRAGQVGDSNGTSRSGLSMSAFGGTSWHHWAFVRDNSTEVNSIRIYHNGERVAEANALRPIFVSNRDIESFRLLCTNYGSRVNQVWLGKFDDFRVYNRALTPAEVGWLGTKGTGTVPFTNSSNLKTSTPEKISFNDFAMLAKNWLVEQRWPNP